MLNNLKHKLNEKFNTNFDVKVLISDNLNNGAFYASVTGSIKRADCLIVTPEFYGNLMLIPVDSYVKIGDVYHIDSEKGTYIVRIL